MSGEGRGWDVGGGVVCGDALARWAPCALAAAFEPRPVRHPSGFDTIGSAFVRPMQRYVSCLRSRWDPPVQGMYLGVGYMV